MNVSVLSQQLIARAMYQCLRKLCENPLINFIKPCQSLFCPFVISQSLHHQHNKLSNHIHNRDLHNHCTIYIFTIETSSIIYVFTIETFSIIYILPQRPPKSLHHLHIHHRDLLNHCIIYIICKNYGYTMPFTLQFIAI